MDELDSARTRTLEKGGLAGERFSPPAGRAPLAPAQDDTLGAQFTAIAHLQPFRGDQASLRGDARQSSGAAGSNSISSCASERDESGDSPKGDSSLAAALARLDHMRALESVTMTRVAESALAAEANDSELALRLAHEAMETLNRLRAVVLEEQRLGSAGSQGNDQDFLEMAPTSSAINLFDLLVMAKSNLAAQLHRSGQLGEALELYTQLCKLASSQSGGARQSTRFLLYRFGLQMGNVLLEMGDHARALKHFRLTLDRLSSASGRQQGQLRAKLMSNIAVALMGANQKQSVEHSSALQRLLADNLLTGNSQQQQQQQRQEPLNANHHRFGLNLVASYHAEADLRAMRATLGHLLKVDIGGHYVRVLVGSEAPSAEMWNRERDQADAEQARDLLAAAHARERAAPRAEVSQRQVLAAIHADKLESLICERRNEIARALLASCALIVHRAGHPLESDATNEDAAANHDEPIGRQVDEGSQSVQISARRALAGAQCIKLLASSELYGHLASEFRLNNVLRSLTARRRLRSALRSLVAEARDEQRAAAAPGGAAAKSRAQQVAPRSPMVAANLALLCGAAGQPSKAAELMSAPNSGRVSSHWQELVNLTTCQVALKELARAEAAAERALDVEPTNWLTNYNSLLIARLAGRHFDEVSARTRKSLAAQLLEMEQPRALARLSLAQYQLALFYKQSSMDAKSDALFGRLADGAGGAGPARLAPEVILQASRAASNDEAATAMLRATSQRHAYHTPTAERLVALHISRFQYREAELLLAACLRNRPDQSRWLQLLAECHRHAARYPAAIRIYKHAIRLFPADTSCLRALAKLSDELGLIDERDLCQTRLKTISDSLGKLEAALD